MSALTAACSLKRFFKFGCCVLLLLLREWVANPTERERTCLIMLAGVLVWNCPVQIGKVSKGVVVGVDGASGGSWACAIKSRAIWALIEVWAGELGLLLILLIS